jgi:hypothetical protein
MSCTSRTMMAEFDVAIAQLSPGMGGVEHLHNDDAD